MTSKSATVLRRHVVRRLLTVFLAVLATVAAQLANGSTANAAQAQNAYYYSHWNFAGASVGYWNVDQQVRIEKRAPATYWAQYWNWKGSDDGGYVGLQTDGIRGDGTTGDMAIFSLWNANAANGPLCATFDGEGNGYSCRLAYPFGNGGSYRYRVLRRNADAGGQWWGAWIRNLNTGADTYIGSIRVAKQYTLLTEVMNFVEYFGPAPASCWKVPQSTAVWTQPSANSWGNGVYSYGSSYVATAADRGACTGGSASPVPVGSTRGVRVILGG